MAPRRPFTSRVAALVAAGIITGVAYVALDPFAPTVSAQDSTSTTEADQSGNGAEPGDGSESANNDPETSEVILETLESSDDYNADLSFGNERTLSARADGTITWLPEDESILEPGDVLWEIDRQPVIYVDGEIPMYRDLFNGVKKGDDIRQLEEFLIAEGYGPDGWEADTSFNRTTRNAVKAFQKDEGMTQNGVLGPANIVVGTTAMRVSTTADLGAAATDGPILTVTDAIAEVTMSATSRQLPLFQKSPDVLVVLADGQELSARLDETKATPADESGRFGYSLTYVVDGSVGEAQPVKVRIVQVLASDALTVPVDALIALAEGGYAVEVQTGSGLALRAVEVIDFDDTRVAITGDVVAGDLVVVP